MTADPWALLREARESVALDAEAAGNSRFASEGERVSGLLARIDAALAGRDKPVEELNAEERIWRAYRNRELTEDEARERLAALKAEEAK